MVFPLRRPRKIPPEQKQNNEKKERFKNRVKKIFKLNKNLKKRVIMFFDGAFFHLESTIKRIWKKKGSKPSVQSSPSKDKIGVLGSVNLEKGEIHDVVFKGNFDSDVFIAYLELLIKEKYNGVKILLILDNASPHKSKKVKKWLKENNNKIKLLYLPPYSPQLNPKEIIWKDIREKKTHNKYFNNMTALKKSLDDYIIQYSIPNEHIKSKCKFKYVS